MLFRDLLIKTVPLLIVCPQFLSTSSNCCITKELVVWFANDAKNIVQRPELHWVICLSIQFYNRLKHKVNVLCLLGSSPQDIKWCKAIGSNRSVPNIISLLIYVLIAFASCIHLSSFLHSDFLSHVTLCSAASTLVMFVTASQAASFIWSLFLQEIL